MTPQCTPTQNSFPKSIFWKWVGTRLLWMYFLSWATVSFHSLQSHFGSTRSRCPHHVTNANGASPALLRESMDAPRRSHTLITSHSPSRDSQDNAVCPPREEIDTNSRRRTEPALVDLLRCYGRHGQYFDHNLIIFITISDIEDDEDIFLGGTPTLRISLSSVRMAPRGRHELR